MKVLFAALACFTAVIFFSGPASGQAQCCTPGPKPAAPHQEGSRNGLAGSNGTRDIAEEFRDMLKRDKEARARSCEGQPGYKLVNGNSQDGSVSLEALSMGGTNAEQDGMPTAEAIEQARARTRAEKEMQIAVARTGTRVCRRFAVGISETDWIRGVVVETGSSHLCVKINDPGHFTHTLNNIEITRGSLIWDTVSAWMPCAE